MPGHGVAQMATLVERTSRFTVLVQLDAGTLSPPRSGSRRRWTTCPLLVPQPDDPDRRADGEDSDAADEACGEEREGEHHAAIAKRLGFGIRGSEPHSIDAPGQTCKSHDRHRDHLTLNV